MKRIISVLLSVILLCPIMSVSAEQTEQRNIAEFIEQYVYRVTEYRCTSGKASALPDTMYSVSGDGTFMAISTSAGFMYVNPESLLIDNAGIPFVNIYDSDEDRQKDVETAMFAVSALEYDAADYALLQVTKGFSSEFLKMTNAFNSGWANISSLPEDQRSKIPVYTGNYVYYIWVDLETGMSFISVKSKA